MERKIVKPPSIKINYCNTYFYCLSYNKNAILHTPNELETLKIRFIYPKMGGMTELAEAKNLLAMAKGVRVKEALSNLVEVLERESTDDGQEQPQQEIPEAEMTEAPAEGAGTESAGVRDIAANMTKEEKNELGGVCGVGMVDSSNISSQMVGSAPVSSVAPEAGGSSTRFATISTYAWDQGEYNSPWVTVYVTLEGVGSCKEGVTCEFSKQGFDLRVDGLGGRNHRLLQDRLEKDIVPEESKFLVKKNKVVLKLKKVKGEFGSYVHWSALTAKKQRKPDGAAKDPTAGIMDMMKDMYDDGDDNMKKIIGEAMLKSKRGEKADPMSSYEPPSSTFDDDKMFGAESDELGGLGDDTNFGDGFAGLSGSLGGKGDYPIG